MPLAREVWGAVAVLAVAIATTGCAADQDATRPSVSRPALVPRPSPARPSARPGRLVQRGDDPR